MLAAWYERLGDADNVLSVGDLPMPRAAAGEVLVRVRASGINPSDVKKRAGWHGGALEYPRIIPHSDGAGEIVEVGDGVDRSRIGTRVWLYNAQHQRAHGTAASFVALPEALAVALPDDVPWHQGACLGVPACTAYNAVMGAGRVEGLCVMVAGGAGAVGQLAVQIAALAGAEVIATVSSEEKAQIALEAGASEVIDYRHTDVAQAVLDVTHGAGVDRIVEVDLGANLALDAHIIKPRGVIASYSSTTTPRFELDYYAFGYKGVTLRFIQVYMLDAKERAEAVAALNRWLSQGRLASRIAASFPLARIAEAHRMQEGAHAPGNIVLDIED